MFKYKVFLNGEQVDTIYADNDQQALEIAIKSYGLTCDVEQCNEQC